MTEEQKQQYIETIVKKAYAYADGVLSDLKGYASEDEYNEVMEDIVQAFLCGADTAVKLSKELTKK
jgi:pyruvate-formate lyase-activating enzyme